MARRLGVVDLGTNTIKYSVMEVDDRGGYREIDARADTVRLGAGIASSGMIDAERATRALDSLLAYERHALELGAEAFIGVATSAMRRASNGPDILQQFSSRTRWQIRVISGDLEAQLTWAGLQSLFPVQGDFLLVDIGGGSTEIIAIRDGSVLASESINLGSGVLADEWFTLSPPGSEVAGAKASALATLAVCPVVSSLSAPCVVLSGGNGLFLRQIAKWNAVAIDFSPAAGTALMERIAEIPAVMTAAYLGITEERAAMLPAGAAIASALMELVDAREVVAVPSGVRAGIVRLWAQNQWELSD